MRLVVYPAVVRRPDVDDLAGVKVFLAEDGQVEVYAEQAGAAVLVLSGVARVNAIPGRVTRRDPLLVEVDGVAWTVLKGSGCGCRSPLKHFVPVRPQTIAGGS